MEGDPDKIIEGVEKAWEVGTGVGDFIEEQTGAGSALGDLVYDASTPEASQAALHHSETASDSWDQGSYGTAVVEGFETAGSMIEGAWDGLTGSGPTNAESQ